MKMIATLCLWLCSMESLFANYAYVVNYAGNNISIVDLINEVTVGYVDNGSFTLLNPIGIRFTPDNLKAFVISQGNNSVFVIDPTQNLIVGKVNTGSFPFSAPANIAISPDGTKAYVTNPPANTISVIDVATTTVTGYVNPGAFPFNYPFDVGFRADGALAGVTNFLGNNGSIIDVAIDTVVEYVPDVGFPANGPRHIGLIGNTGVYITEYNASSAAAVSVGSLVTEMITGYVNPNGFIFSNADMVFISPDLQHAYIQDSTTNQISIVNIPTNTVTGYVNATFQNPNDFHVSFDNNTLYVVNSLSHIVSVIDLVSNTQSGVINNSAFPFNNPVSLDLANTIALPVPPPVRIPAPPTSLQGFKKQNVFASQTELINLITWKPSAGLDVPVFYQVYRDAALTNLATVVESNQPLEFTDHDRRKGHTYTYYVVAVDANGRTSLPAQVSISR